MDGRKHTGGRVEVKVRLREPLSGQDVQTSTERWLVIDSSKVNMDSIRNTSEEKDEVWDLLGAVRCSHGTQALTDLGLL
ncbi:hypothetical protein XENOCAPTIV_022780 [Xenoophorus captivus]|uniref:Uncharacterized protein n=1 Tax=Xenoophorus captivus TaxID=1517983 RepID=A0ABV0QNI4_9TELE